MMIERKTILENSQNPNYDQGTFSALAPTVVSSTFKASSGRQVG
jgi:hypothetical protein